MAIACTLSVLWIAPPAAAQSERPPNRDAEPLAFRLMHEGEFLPEGTAVVIIRQPAPDRPPQPKLLLPEAYPISPSYVLQWDTLGTRGQTLRPYPTTSTSGQLYFAYAQAPDGTLYWSYSATHERLIFDVHATGVLTMAPAGGPLTQATLRNRYFADDPTAADAPDTTALAGIPPDSVRTAQSEPPAFLTAPPRPEPRRPAKDMEVLVYALLGGGLLLAVGLGGLFLRMRRQTDELRAEAQALRATMLDQQAAHTTHVRRLERAVVDAVEDPAAVQPLYKTLAPLYRRDAPAMPNPEDDA